MIYSSTAVPLLPPVRLPSVPVRPRSSSARPRPGSSPSPPRPRVPAFVPPVDALNRGHTTLWGNLGEWSGTSDYVDAAEALALTLGRAAALGPGQRVVDVGAGAGDQLRLWVEGFGVRHVTAVEKDPALAARARSRVREWGLEERVRVVAGPASTAEWTGDPVDAVLALDSAYFFESRTAFLERCRRVLRPGGVLALTDLLLGEGRSASVSRRIAPLFGVPRGSLRTEAEYRAALAGAGCLEVVIRDRTEDVLGGFARWARGGGSGSGLGGPRLTRMGLSATGRMAGLLAGSGGLRYVVVTARRGEG